MARLAAQQEGVLSLAELRRCGLARDATTVRVRSGRLHRRYCGVYAVGHTRLSPVGELLAAVKACGDGAVLSHRSAAVLWGLVEPAERDVDVAIPASARRAHPGIRVHRAKALVWPDVTRHRTVPVTAPARTLVDLAGVLPAPALRRAVREAQARRLAQVDGILAVLERLGPRPGTRALRAILATGPAPTRSELEDVLLDLLLRGGLAHPDVNVPLDLAGRRVIPDFRWPGRRLVVEADGARWHAGRLAREDDAERQALLEAHGERIVRVTWQQAVERPRQTLARLVAAGAPSRPGAGRAVGSGH